MIEAAGFVAALLIGGVLGLLGGGGSILATPAFAYLLNVEPKASIIASLAVVAVSSLVGGVIGIRKSEVDFTRALLFIVGSLPGAFVGGEIGRDLDDRVQMLLFAVVMITIAVVMLTRSSETPETSVVPAPKQRTVGRIAGGVLVGVLVGVLTGIVGAGGGFMIVPALTIFFAVPMKRATSTSMIVIALNSLAGLAGYLADQNSNRHLFSMAVGAMSFPMYVLLFALIMTTGVLLTQSLRSSIHSTILQRLFSIFLIVLGITVFVINV